MLTYPGVIHKDPDGLWIEFPDFPEISGTQGDDMEDLMQMAEDCLGGYLELLLSRDKEIPEPSDLKGENILHISVSADIAVPILFKHERKRQGLKQNEVAERMGAKSYRSIQNVERKKRSPSIKTLLAIAGALGKKLVIDLE